MDWPRRTWPTILRSTNKCSVYPPWISTRSIRYIDSSSLSLLYSWKSKNASRNFNVIHWIPDLQKYRVFLFSGFRSLVAIMTERVNRMTEHLSVHPHASLSLSSSHGHRITVSRMPCKKCLVREVRSPQLFHDFCRALPLIFEKNQLWEACSSLLLHLF